MELDIKTKSPIVLADPSQIQQVLMNLVTNAVYAMGERPTFRHAFDLYPPFGAKSTNLTLSSAATCNWQSEIRGRG